jgi:3'-phosphoadenosine 5'-phosphosulfate sulfotransferase (PAPS reductase)/FAD synthetase
MKKIVMFSGGKDSACLVHKMISEGEDIEVVFCDTGWELPETITYIKQFRSLYLKNKLTVLKSKIYKGMIDMIISKKYIPTVYHRFCTEALKIKPLQEYIKNIGEEVHMYNGVRKEESLSRRNIVEYMYDTNMSCWLHRPLAEWTSKQVMNYLVDNKVIINPLYKMGFKRVGCGPCILCSLPELAVLSRVHPERIDEIDKVEKILNQTYFFSKMIPERFRTAESSKGNLRGSIKDVIAYLNSKPKYYELAESAGDSCMSYYNLCE